MRVEKLPTRAVRCVELRRDRHRLIVEAVASDVYRGYSQSAQHGLLGAEAIFAVARRTDAHGELELGVTVGVAVGDADAVANGG